MSKTTNEVKSKATIPVDPEQPQTEQRPFLALSIPGMDRVLPPLGYIEAYRSDDTVIAVHGAPGVGKTLLSLQMAFGIAANNSKAILYLIKDTNPQTLMQKAIINFNCFDQLVFLEKENDVYKSRYHAVLGLENVASFKKFIDDYLFSTDLKIKSYLLALGYSDEYIEHLDKNDISNYHKIINKKFTQSSSFCSLRAHLSYLLGNEITGKLTTAIAKETPKDKRVVVLKNLHLEYAKIEEKIKLGLNNPEKFYFLLDNEFKLLFIEGYLSCYPKSGSETILNDCKILRGVIDSPKRSYQRWCSEQTSQMVNALFVNSGIKDPTSNNQTENSAYRSFLRDLLMADLLDSRQGSYIAFASLTPGTFNTNPFNRYADYQSEKSSYSPASSLTPLSPDLAPLFSWLRREDNGMHDSSKITGELQEKIRGIKDFWNNQLMVVCDSITPTMFEECIQLHHSSSRSTLTKINKETLTNDCNLSKPVWQFIVESDKLPISAAAGFAPDFQIYLKAENIKHDICKRTLQILKTRHQYAVNEPFPFLIAQYGNEYGYVVEGIPNLKNYTTTYHQPGLTILPSIATITQKISKNKDKVEDKKDYIKFGPEIDNNVFHLKDEQYFEGNGCTLLITENRCKSTALGLHFLLHNIFDEWNKFKCKDTVLEGKRHDKCIGFKQKNDVLFISLDLKLPHIIEMLNQYKYFEFSIEKPETDSSKSFFSESHQGVFHVLKLTNNKGNTVQLILYIPDFEWKLPEEILDDINWILDKNRIRRVLFSRTSRIKTCWPLVNDPHALMSAFIMLCLRKTYSLMFIDDLGDQSSHTGHVTSDYLSFASNIIRLKRVAIRGTQTVAFEVLNSLSNVKHARPLELCEETTIKKDDVIKVLKVRDTFRGYYNIFTDEPKHCKVRLDLPYDRVNSPLHAEVLQIKHNLKLLFDDDVEVRPLRPSNFRGINATLAHLANLTHDTCHIIAIDEIWLPSLLAKGSNRTSGSSALTAIESDDLRRIIPEKFIKDIPDPLNLLSVGHLFITQAMVISQNIVQSNLGEYKRFEQPHAIPYYHNWGVFAVSLPKSEIFIELRRYVPKNCTQIENTQNGKYDSVTWTHVKELKSEWDNAEARNYNFRALIGKYDIKFFTFCNESAESVVCFFLELLLSSSPYNKVFIKQKELLVFTEERNTSIIKSFIEAVGTIFELLCEDERQKIATGRQLQLPEEIESSTTPIKEPAVTALFSREWITSVHTINTKDDWRERIVLTHLPVWDETRKDHLSKLIISNKVLRNSIDLHQTPQVQSEISELENLLFPSISTNNQNLQQIQLNLHVIASRYLDRPPKIIENYLKKIRLYEKLKKEHDHKLKLPKKCPIKSLADLDIFLNDSITRMLNYRLIKTCEYRGPTVSGTWYLGVLDGGNTDLAADIIGELTSEIREAERVRNKKAAGVYSATYESISSSIKPVNGESGFSPFPYSDIIRLCHCGNNSFPDEDHMYVFPFCRSMIKNYPEVSIELYGMIRQVLGLDKDDPQFNSTITSIVVKTICRINQIQSRGEQ